MHTHYSRDYLTSCYPYKFNFIFKRSLQKHLNILSEQKYFFYLYELFLLQAISVLKEKMGISGKLYGSRTLLTLYIYLKY